MKTVWLHAGTPKTGSTSIQRFGVLQRRWLRWQGISFLTRRKKLGSWNDLAIAIRHRDAEKALVLGAKLDRKIREDAREHVALSAEMMPGIDLGLLREVVPSLREFPVKVVFYLRRQDQWIESAFKQKVKNGKSSADLDAFLERFGGPGPYHAAGYYDELVKTWDAAFPNGEIVPRRFGRTYLRDGDVVADFFGLMGLEEIPEDRALPAENNPSPCRDALELLTLLNASGGAFNMRAVQRRFIRLQPPRTGDGVRFVSKQAAREMMDHYAEGNEWLRQTYFPDEKQLFDQSDLEGEEDEAAATPLLTAEQQDVLAKLFKAISLTHLERA